MSDRGFIDKLYETIAQLLKEPKTAKELIDATGYKSDTIYGYIDRGCRSGVLYIFDYVRATPLGPIEARYSVQVKPFDRLDAPPP